MSHPLPLRHDTGEDLQALCRVIADLARRCAVDLADRSAVRRLIDGDFPAAAGAAASPLHELRRLLILRYRLEDGSSEDIGVDGLARLWRQCREALAVNMLQGATAS